MWKQLSSKVIFKHPRLTLVEDDVLLPNGKKTKYLKYQSNGGGAVTIICQRLDGKILFQKEYSYPPNQQLLQFPGGAIDSGEDPKVAANRELSEEMGYRGKDLKLIGSYLANNRRSDLSFFIFLTTSFTKTQTKRESTEEGMEELWFSEDEIKKMISKGQIINCHTLASWAVFKSRK